MEGDPLLPPVGERRGVLVGGEARRARSRRTGASSRDRTPGARRGWRDRRTSCGRRRRRGGSRPRDRRGGGPAARRRRRSGRATRRAGSGRRSRGSGARPRHARAARAAAAGSSRRTPPRWRTARSADRDCPWCVGPPGRSTARRRGASGEAGAEHGIGRTAPPAPRRSTRARGGSARRRTPPAPRAPRGRRRRSRRGASANPPPRCRRSAAVLPGASWRTASCRRRARAGTPIATSPPCTRVSRRTAAPSALFQSGAEAIVHASHPDPGVRR